MPGYKHMQNYNVAVKQRLHSLDTRKFCLKMEDILRNRENVEIRLNSEVE